MPLYLPCGNAGGLQILCCQGFEVNNYDVTLDALNLKPSDVCNVGVKAAISKGIVMSLRMTIILYAAYTLTSVAGLTVVKLYLPAAFAAHGAGGVVWSQIFFVSLGVALYVGSFALWMMILTTNPLSTAYPVAIGLTLVFTTLVAGFLLHENIGLGKLAGIALILLGIILIFSD